VVFKAELDIRPVIEWDLELVCYKLNDILRKSCPDIHFLGGHPKPASEGHLKTGQL
jgi:hypothetical protein